MATSVEMLEAILMFGGPAGWAFLAVVSLLLPDCIGPRALLVVGMVTVLGTTIVLLVLPAPTRVMLALLMIGGHWVFYSLAGLLLWRRARRWWREMNRDD